MVFQSEHLSIRVCLWLLWDMLNLTRFVLWWEMLPSSALLFCLFWLPWCVSCVSELRMLLAGAVSKSIQRACYVSRTLMGLQLREKGKERKSRPWSSCMDKEGAMKSHPHLRTFQQRWLLEEAEYWVSSGMHPLLDCLAPAHMRRWAGSLSSRRST